MTGYLPYLAWALGTLVLAAALFFASSGYTRWQHRRLQRAGVKTDPISPSDPIDGRQGPRPTD
ncbi:MAG TPA: hypothetical protein VJR58_20825 [Vineibacter sp.]|nr:hypothetical protein [Vineibacter sp.]